MQADQSSDTVLACVARGEPGAAERCLDRYGGLVWSLARRYFARRADAEDAVQEAFVALWASAGRFDPSVAAEAAFVATIARRRMVDLLRRQRRRDDASLGERVSLENLASDDGVTPAELRDEARNAQSMMEQLPPREREVLDLAIGRGLTQIEIAQRTGMPLGTVKSHARRGLARLRNLLQAPARAGEAAL